VTAGLSDSSVRTWVVPFNSSVASAPEGDWAHASVLATEKNNARYLGKCDPVYLKLFIGRASARLA
jgi:hypothetical protein